MCCQAAGFFLAAMEVHPSGHTRARSYMDSPATVLALNRRDGPHSPLPRQLVGSLAGASTSETACHATTPRNEVPLVPRAVGVSSNTSTSASTASTPEDENIQEAFAARLQARNTGGLVISAYTDPLPAVGTAIHSDVSGISTSLSSHSMSLPVGLMPSPSDNLHASYSRDGSGRAALPLAGAASGTEDGQVDELTHQHGVVPTSDFSDRDT